MNGFQRLDALELKLCLPFNGIALDAGAFHRRIETVALQTTQVKQDVRHPAVWNYEAVASCHIKPFPKKHFESQLVEAQIDID